MTYQRWLDNLLQARILGSNLYGKTCPSSKLITAIGSKTTATKSVFRLWCCAYWNAVYNVSDDDMGNYDVSDNNISLCVERIDRRIFFLKRRGIRSPQSEQTKGVIRNTYLPFHRVPCPSRGPRHRTVCYQFMGKNEIFPAPQETQAVLEFNRDFEHAFFFFCHNK